MTNYDHYLEKVFGLHRYRHIIFDVALAALSQRALRYTTGIQRRIQREFRGFLEVERALSIGIGGNAALCTGSF